MIRACLLSLVLLAAPAGAEVFPGLARVTGVAADDVLNVRAEPSASAAILATIAPGTEGIEVLEVSGNGKWALVPLPEGSGWVARRFLQTMPQDPASLLRPMRCTGTEPFWTMEIAGFGGTWSTPEEQGVVLALPVTEAAPEGWFALAEDPVRGHGLSLIVTRGSCSDGMSDRRFGLTALIFDKDYRNGRNRIWQGCCTLDRR
ncbi:MAG: SH3 domain-containing protein [Rhodobacteraceae bacterium]|nr:SH3 domain-containing protein [Paracoccaceae bacterium]